MSTQRFSPEYIEAMQKEGYVLIESWLPDLSNPLMQEKLRLHNGNFESVLDEDETMMFIEKVSVWPTEP
ncbi:MAG: hypothetical protein RI926_469 [Actinomycetota bacterium]|jgi:hypothetical protein